MVPLYQNGEKLTDNDPASLYRGRDIRILRHTNFGHCVVYWVQLYHNTAIEYALREDKILASA